MKRTRLKKVGKIGKINLEANQKLQDLFQEKGIYSCEVHLEGCLGAFTSAFAHRHKRYWYRNQPEKLSEFNQVIMMCQNCHNLTEHNRELNRETFKRLRDKE